VTSGATRANQRSRILGLLIAARGDWVSLLSIKAEACQYNARILELRRLGFQIENKIRDIDGARMSWFRIEPAVTTAPSELSASLSEATAPETASSFPEFGRMAPERYGVD